MRAVVVALAILGITACSDGSATSEVFGPDDTQGEPEVEQQDSDLVDALREELNLPAGEPFEEFVEVSDDSGALRAEVPAAWNDLDGRAGPFGPDVHGSTDLADYLSTYDVSGFQLTATAESATGEPELVLDELALRTTEDCERGSRRPFADRGFDGVSQVFEQCGGGDGAFVWVAATPSDASFVVVAGVQVLTEADLVALDRLLSSFEVDL